jgi:hypothetical protein
MSQYFYDSQVRRFLIQFARLFSYWEVTRGNDPKGNPIIVRVPVIYGDMSRQVASIINNNSTSTLPSAPLISYYITGLEYDQQRMQNPSFVDKVQVRQRAYNQDSRSYETVQGQAYTVERLMPVPYTLRVTVDIWTTNTQQKLELFEQIGAIFNPSLEIQNSDNFLDWTSLSVVYQDGITYTSRSVPQGTSNPIDILSWKFYMPIWISAPAKLKKMGVIHKVIASIFKGQVLEDIQDDDLILGTRQKITPYGYQIMLIGNNLQLLPADQPFIPPNDALALPTPPDTSEYWSAFLNMYGAVKEGISQIWLENPYMDNYIVGTIRFNPSDDRLLIYDIDQDTLPQNTLDPVNAVINPRLVGPSAGLMGPVDGRRYLIVEPIGHPGDPTIAWGNLIANANDIIEYDGGAGRWVVSFDSQSATAPQFVLNLNTNVQYRYTDGEWTKSFEGFYDQGDFHIVI